MAIRVKPPSGMAAAGGEGVVERLGQVLVAVGLDAGVVEGPKVGVPCTPGASAVGDVRAGCVPRWPDRRRRCRTLWSRPSSAANPRKTSSAGVRCSPHCAWVSYILRYIASGGLAGGGFHRQAAPLGIDVGLQREVADDEVHPGPRTRPEPVRSPVDRPAALAFESNSTNVTWLSGTEFSR